MHREGAQFRELERGEVVGGRYRVVRVIGRGGMGIVYEVEDLRLRGVSRAIKIAASRLGCGFSSAEANMLMRLHHPHLPLITDYFPSEGGEGVEAVVMDYIDGDTVSAILTQSLAGFTFSELIHIGIQLCSALIYLHAQPDAIIHRDLKPSNVMIDRNGSVKLIDFGISRKYKEGQTSDTQRLGSAGFAAPEQQEGRQSDVRTDIYGLGALLYYIATNGETLAEEHGALRLGSALARLPKQIPRSFVALLERMLQRLPQQRYQTMDEVEQALRVFSAQAPLQPVGSKRWELHMISAKPPLISVVSLAPGSGATMMSITLALLLAQRGHAVSAAEFYGLSPEWSELLPDWDANLPIDTGEGAVSFSDCFVRRNHKLYPIEWFALNSHRLTEAEHDGRAFEHLLRGRGSGINIIDFSGQWQKPEAMQWIRSSRHLVVVADPFIAKWQLASLRKLDKLKEELEAAGSSVHWVANKDCKFQGRKEWMKLFPERPAAAVPLLPQDALLEALWNGQWPTEASLFGGLLNRALGALCDKVVKPSAAAVRYDR